MEDKKLTLSLNAVVVEKAKRYAKEQGISLSRMIENYLAALLPGQEPGKEEISVSPLVRRLTGVISLEEAVDHRSAYVDYLEEKYR